MDRALKTLLATLTVGLTGGCFNFEGTLCDGEGECGEGYYCDSSNRCRENGNPDPDAGTDDGSGLDAGFDAGNPTCVPNSPCGSDVGECSFGAQQCLADGGLGECVGGTGPAAEFCDGKDNDCNGQVDEDESGQVLRDTLCADQEGVCEGVRRACVNGVFEQNCTGLSYGPDYEPYESRCDRKDNDCNGVVDSWPAAQLANNVAEFSWVAVDGGFGAVMRTLAPDAGQIVYVGYPPDLRPDPGGVAAVILDEGEHALAPKTAKLGDSVLAAWGEIQAAGQMRIWLTRFGYDGGTVFAPTVVAAGAIIDEGSAAVSANNAGDAIAVAWNDDAVARGRVYRSDGLALSSAQDVGPVGSSAINVEVAIAPWSLDGFLFATLDVDLITEVNLTPRSKALAVLAAGGTLPATDDASGIRAKPATLQGAIGISYGATADAGYLSIDGGTPHEFLGYSSNLDPIPDFDFAPLDGDTYVVWRSTSGEIHGRRLSQSAVQALTPAGAQSPSVTAVGGGLMGLAWRNATGTIEGKLICAPPPTQ